MGKQVNSSDLFIVTKVSVQIAAIFTRAEFQKTNAGPLCVSRSSMKANLNRCKLICKENFVPCRSIDRSIDTLVYNENGQNEKERKKEGKGNERINVGK